MIQLSLRYKASEKFDLNVDLNLPEQGFTVVFGPSGSGKTSLMRCVMGLERDAVGTVLVGGRVWQKHKVNLPTHLRDVSAVFQESALFPHLTVRNNLRFASKRADTLSEEADLIDFFKLAPLLDRMPSTLSGGEKKRVAIARALLSQPALLCMDEPLAGLDSDARKSILSVLLRLQKKTSLAVLYITHALDEVFCLANYLVLLQAGRVLREGLALDLLPGLLAEGEDPSSVIEVVVEEYMDTYHLFHSQYDGQSFYMPIQNGYEDYSKGDRCRIRINARDVSLSKEPLKGASILNTLNGLVQDISTDAPSGMVLVKVRLHDSILQAYISCLSSDRLCLSANDKVYVHIKTAAFI